MFYWTFWPTRVVFGPFLDVFWTVHLPAFSPALEPDSSAPPCLGCMPVLWFITACWSGPDLYQGYELLLVALIDGFLRCWFFPSRFSSGRQSSAHFRPINPNLLCVRMVISGPRVVSGVLRVDGSGPRQTGFATYFNFEWILKFCLFLGYPLLSFGRFWTVLVDFWPVGPFVGSRFTCFFTFPLFKCWEACICNPGWAMNRPSLSSAAGA